MAGSSSRTTTSLWATAAESIGFLAVLGLLCGVFGALSDSFLSAGTVQLIVNRIPPLVVVSTGMTLVLIIGGIDLSVGSLLAVSAAMTGTLIYHFDWSPPTAALAGLATGTFAGFINGLISVGARIPSFIVTLGMLEILRGATYLITNSKTEFIGFEVEWFSSSMPTVGVSPAFLVAAAVVVIGQLILSHTTYGRYCRAIGGNREAVRMSGVNSRPYEIATFAAVGFLCAVGGVMHTSKLATTDPNAGTGLELLAIAAAVIGGTSLAGGRGSIVNTLFGVLIIAVLESGLAQIGAQEAVKRIVTGLVIILAVILDAYRTGIRQWASSLVGKRS